MELNKIYNVDCLEFMKSMPDKCVDLVVTSPPYNVGNNNMTDAKYGSKDKDSMTQGEYLHFLSNTLEESLRITKWYVFINIQSLSFNKAVIIEWLYKFRNDYKEKIVWDKNQVAPAIEPGVLNSKFEDIYIFGNNPHKRKFDRSFFPQGNLSNVIKGNNASQNEYAKIHKATYPEYLPLFFINNFSDKDDIIFDPFMGSGTTAIACLKTNRKYIGCEISKKYCDIAEKRIKEFTDQTTLF